MDRPTTSPVFSPAAGLYALKPRFVARLTRLADALASRRVHPDAITAAGLACSLLGGAALAASATHPVWLWAVPLLAFARILFNALDGLVARRTGQARPWGLVLNEVSDRVADVAFLGGLLFAAASPVLLGVALIAVLLASYVGVVAQAAGAPRQYGGPLGKADRMLWLSLAAVAVALTGDARVWSLLLAGFVAGALLTAVRRLEATHAAL